MTSRKPSCTEPYLTTRPRLGRGQSRCTGLVGELMGQRSRQTGSMFAGVDRTIVLDQHDRLGLSPGLRSKETLELLQMGDEIAAALGRAGVDDELARGVIE
jgi:hypothetical protein